MQRAISTVLKMTSGDVVVLGGLQQARNSAEENGIRWLPSWLRSHASDDSDSDLVVVLEVSKV